MDRLLGQIFDRSEHKFIVQETFILDFKETIPTSFAKGYGAGIIRLALAFHNTYGGIIIFGVKDDDFSVSGISEQFDIESFNRFITELTGRKIECIVQTYSVQVGPNSKKMAIVLVPRRRLEAPLKLIRELEKYPEGMLWVRDRHQVVVATSEHLPLLYSIRNSNLFGADENNQVLIHKSMPPTPATMKNFVGRMALMERLWQWLIHEDHPRLYLYGPGGSGKSTLAYEFAKNIIESSSDIVFPIRRGTSLFEGLDYVIFLSGKETELNPFSGKQQNFSLRNFSTASEQVGQILFHSGQIDESELIGLSQEQWDDKLTELFDHYNGLIVIDDIDALSRRNEDTGEELLFLKSAQSKKRTKILYTLRYIPPYALRSSIAIPGLDEIRELPDFISLCCKQFETPKPNESQISHIKKVTARLPLVIETIIGLRRGLSSYEESFNIFDQKGGEEARRYLYQREYDHLDPRGKSKYLLAAFSVFDTQVSSRTMSNVLSFSDEQIRDSLAEISGIFLSTVDADNGETLYELSAPAKPFVALVAPRLDRYQIISQRVKHFKNEKNATTPEDAAFIFRMDRMIRSNKYQDIIEFDGQIPDENPVKENPRYKSLLGQAYAGNNIQYRTEAIELFKQAIGLNYRDVFMMRSWYYLERRGDSASEAKIVCEIVINDPKTSNRHMSEFLAKRGDCLSSQAMIFAWTDRERAISYIKQSLSSYFEGIWIGRGVSELDRSKQKRWLTEVVREFFLLIGNNIEPVFDFVESLPEQKHDVDLEAAAILIEPLRVLAKVNREDARKKAKNMCNRTIGRLNRSFKKTSDLEGFSYIIETLEDIRKNIEAKYGKI